MFLLSPDELYLTLFRLLSKLFWFDNVNIKRGDILTRCFLSFVHLTALYIRRTESIVHYRFVFISKFSIKNTADVIHSNLIKN